MVSSVSLTKVISYYKKENPVVKIACLSCFPWQKGEPELTEFKTESRLIEKVQQVRKNPFHGGFLQLVPLLSRLKLSSSTSLRSSTKGR